jgi:hypothetical protein
LTAGSRICNTHSAKASETGYEQASTVTVTDQSCSTSQYEGYAPEIKAVNVFSGCFADQGCSTSLYEGYAPEIKAVNFFSGCFADQGCSTSQYEGYAPEIKAVNFFFWLFY